MMMIDIEVNINIQLETGESIDMMTDDIITDISEDVAGQTADILSEYVERGYDDTDYEYDSLGDGGCGTRNAEPNEFVGFKRHRGWRSRRKGPESF